MNSTNQSASSFDYGSDLMPCYYFDESYPPIQVMFRVYMDLPVLFLGLIGNFANIVVFSDSTMRSNAVNRCLLMLSISDFLIIFCGLFMLSLPVAAENTLDSLVIAELVAFATRWLYPLGQVAAFWSVYYTVFVSTFQCIVVRHRRYASKHFSKNRCDFVMAAIFVIGLAFNINRFFEVKMQECYSQRYQSDAHHLMPTELMHNQTYFLIYHIYVTAIVQLIIPVIILVPVNISFVKFLHDARRLRRPLMHLTELMILTLAKNAGVQSYLSSVRRNSLSAAEGLQKDTLFAHAPGCVDDGEGYAHTSVLLAQLPVAARLARRKSSWASLGSQDTFVRNVKRRRQDEKIDKELSVTVMVLSVVAVFLLCNLVTFSTNIIEILAQFSEPMKQVLQSETFTILVEVGNFMVLFNAATTCLIYARFNSGFRELLLDHCTVCCVKAVVGITELQQTLMKAKTTSRRRQNETDKNMNNPSVGSRLSRADSVVVHFNKQQRLLDAELDLQEQTAGIEINMTNGDHKRSNGFIV